MLNWIKEAISANALSKAGGLLIKSSLKKILSRMDPAEYGGMPLLGLDGVSLIAHGNSNAKSIKNAIKAATKAVNQDIVGKITQAIGK